MQRRVTMTDVARAAGVSPMTVSYTYNQPQRVSAASRDKVLRAAGELGYAGPDPSARSLRYGATRTLGVVLGEHLTYAFDDPQAVLFLAGVAEICADRGYGLLIVPTAPAAPPSAGAASFAGPSSAGGPSAAGGVSFTGAGDAERVVAAAVDAYIVWTTTADDPVLAAALSTRRPVVVHGGPPLDGAALIGIDNRRAAREVGLEVFAGARRPAVLSFPVDRRRETFVGHGVDPDDVAYPVTRDRLAGYRDAALSLGVDWAEVPVGVCRTNDDGEARAVMRDLLEAVPDLDAVAAMGDRLAVAAVSESPHRIRVSGWDDSELARTHDLTTVAQSLRDQGAACALAALGDQAPDHRDSWSVVRRASTRP